MTGFASQHGNAPADRTAGRRGVRAPLAGVVAFVSLVALGMAQIEPKDPAWTRPGFLLAGLAGITAALLLWVARRRVGLVLAIGLALVCVVGTAAAWRERDRVQAEADSWGGFAGTSNIRERGSILSKAEAEAVPKGLRGAELREHLGPPAMTGIQRVFDGPDLPCLAYRREGGRPAPDAQFAFCFRDGRYEVLREW